MSKNLKLITPENKKLTTPSKEVPKDKIKTAIKLGKNMLNFLSKQSPNNTIGVGLSAVQVGFLRRVFVVRFEGFNEIFINPEITYMSDEAEKMEEKCLSYPGESKIKERSLRIAMSCIDKNGNHRLGTFDGFIARIIQHEYDHLNGISCVR